MNIIDRVEECFPGVASTARSVLSVGAQTFVLGLLFQKIMGIDPKLSVFVSFGVISIYSALGGIRAIATIIPIFLA